MLNQIFKNVYMRLDEKAVTMAQPQKTWSGILGLPIEPYFTSGTLGRRELGPETNSDHLPWRIRPTSWENSAHNPGEFGSTFGEFGLLLELNNLYM